MKQNRGKIIEFLKEKLRLEINATHDIIIKAGWGLKFLGIIIFPSGRRLNKRNWRRAREKLNYSNISSYSGLVRKHGKKKIIREFNWIILEKLENGF